MNLPSEPSYNFGTGTGTVLIINSTGKAKMCFFIFQLNYEIEVYGTEILDPLWLGLQYWLGIQVLKKIPAIFLPNIYLILHYQYLFLYNYSYFCDFEGFRYIYMYCIHFFNSSLVCAIFIYLFGFNRFGEKLSCSVTHFFEINSSFSQSIFYSTFLRGTRGYRSSSGYTMTSLCTVVQPQLPVQNSKWKKFWFSRHYVTETVEKLIRKYKIANF